ISRSLSTLWTMIACSGSLTKAPTFCVRPADPIGENASGVYQVRVPIAFIGSARWKASSGKALFCSFCRRTPNKVHKLVADPQLFTCEMRKTRVDADTSAPCYHHLANIRMQE